MASDLTGLIIFLIFVALIIGIIAYAYLSNRLAADKRKELIRAFRASPKIIRDAPILVQGPAESPDLILPTTGEHVAFYALLVLSRETAISSSRNRIHVQIQGLSQTGTSITGTKGFRFFETSGDFIVVAMETPYVVSVKSMLTQFSKGAAMFTGIAAGQVKGAGMSENLGNDTIEFQWAPEALRMLCGFSAPIATYQSTIGGSARRTDYATSSIVTATSRIDSRIHNFIAGQNVPPGILKLLAKRRYTLEEKEEIIVAETFIPLNREVYVFGTFDGDRSIIFHDNNVRLSVSYTDPEME